MNRRSWKNGLSLGLMVAVVAAAVALVGGLFPVQHAQAQGQYSWVAQYYNNPNLEGSPVLQRVDNTIAFNWGTGSPATGVNADNFSVRWGADVALQPGTYRFYALADDNIRVTFNYNLTPTIDTFASGQVNQVVQGDVVVPQAGLYHLQVDYREVTDQAFAYISFQNLATNPQGPSFAAATPSPSLNAGQWTAQYYSNPSLSGDPVAVVSESNPSRDFGVGSPAPNVPVDNWSARWTSTQNLPAGNYTVQLRVDDGARISFNGVRVIDAFTSATGATYTANVYLPGGNTQIVIEYFELGGNAFLDYRLTPVGVTVNPTPAPAATQGSPTGVFVTINAARLNVRDNPSPTGNRLTTVGRGEQYAALARNDNGTWVQINVNGIVGWVSGAYVTLTGGQLPPSGQGGGAAPTAVPAQTGLTVTATPYTVNIRSGPGTQFGRIARLPAGQSATLVGRDAGAQWLQVNYNGIVGWVSSQFARLPAGADVNTVPVTG